ncbi:MAG: class II aldolase/adducin family protein [Spirochaetaceae bacterium]|jgi:L-fuculose-phosphate aldolase|nr:class II aldolase/adducin family protein [Spirochaetaceae bacterium]GMO27874.1 MAG: hypothetical protein Pg6A_15590 [Termitinemataceae bacterium]
MSVEVFLSDDEARRQIIEVGCRMFTKNFVAANDGNISCRVEDGIWATPTGVSKGFMRENELVKLAPDGTVLHKGPLEVSSEIKMHLRVYKENSKVLGVTHAHPPVCTSFAIAGISLDRAIYPEALVNLGIVPCVHYETPGSSGIPDSIAPYCKNYNALLLANHGALSWGRSLMEAYYRMESMEHYALVLMLTGNIIGRSKLLNEEQVAELLEIRQKLGINSGGSPNVFAPKKTNAEDIICSEESAYQTGFGGTSVVRLLNLLERIVERMEVPKITIQN